MTSVSGYIRQQTILDQLRTRHYVQIRDLVAQLHVSYPTVVRDLKALERRALVKRVRGGALISATTVSAAPTAHLPLSAADPSIRAAVHASDSAGDAASATGAATS